MSTPLLMADISDPGGQVIAGTDLVAFAFYLGGATPHVWTRKQIDAQALRWAVPVWVYDQARPTADDGHADGQDAAAALHQMGAPPGVGIRVDMETSVNVAYLRAFRSAVNAGGYWYGTYGSASTVFANPPGGCGYWVADWTGSPFMYPDSRVWATQYADAQQAGTPWDWSELVDTSHCWDRRPPAPPPPPDWAQKLALSLAPVVTELDDAISILRAH